MPLQRGTAGSVSGVAHQVTECGGPEEELCEKEKRYRLLFERNLSGVYNATLDGRVVDCNESFARMLGYESREELLQARALKMFYRRADEQAFISCLKERGALTNFELFLRRKDGQPIWVLENVSLLEANGDGPHLFEGIIMDISELKKAQKDLHTSKEQMRALVTHLQTIREEERARIARELHDELGAALFALKMDVCSLASQWPGAPEPLQNKTREMLKLIDVTIQSVQNICAELRPAILDDLGLAPAMEWQAREFRKRTRIQCRLGVSPADITLDRERSTTVFRIFQEALTNVAQHANATRVDVNLIRKGARVILVVKDNGKGITEEQAANPNSLGLIGIRERAAIWGGRVRITGTPGAGTALKVDIPLG